MRLWLCRGEVLGRASDVLARYDYTIPDADIQTARIDLRAEIERKVRRELEHAEGYYPDMPISITWSSWEQPGMEGYRPMGGDI